MVSDITDENDYHSSQGSGFNQVVFLNTPLTFPQDK